jgi:hypothetical protein
MITFDQYKDCLPLLKEVETLLAGYMKLVCEYNPTITDLQIAIRSFDFDAITIVCEYDLPANDGSMYSFGLFIPPFILFGDKANWPFYVKDYITIYLPSWLNNGRKEKD